MSTKREILRPCVQKSEALLEPMNTILRHQVTIILQIVSDSIERNLAANAVQNRSLENSALFLVVSNNILVKKMKLIRTILYVSCALILFLITYNYASPRLLNDKNILIVPKSSVPALGDSFKGLAFNFLFDRPTQASGFYMPYREIEVNSIRYIVYLESRNIFERILHHIAFSYGSPVHAIKSCDPKFTSPSGYSVGDKISRIKEEVEHTVTFSGIELPDGWKVQADESGDYVMCFTKI